MTQIQGNGFDVAVIRSKRRKTLALAISNGQVTVRMPHKMALHHAEKFIEAKTAWIKDKLEMYPAVSKKQFVDGEQFLFLGQSLSLTIKTSASRNQLVSDKQSLLLQLKSKAASELQIQKQLTAWYKQQAQQILPARCQQLAELLGLIPRHVTVKTYKARWGSCTLAGDIQFNWKLIMAPQTIIDYVITHELCHLKQHNHSPAFWQLVENFCPNYKVHRAWLKTYGQQLTL